VQKALNYPFGQTSILKADRIRFESSRWNTFGIFSRIRAIQAIEASSEAGADGQILKYIARCILERRLAVSIRSAASDVLRHCKEAARSGVSRPDPEFAQQPPAVPKSRVDQHEPW